MVTPARSIARAAWVAGVACALALASTVALAPVSARAESPQVQITRDAANVPLLDQMKVSPTAWLLELAPGDVRVVQVVVRNRRPAAQTTYTVEARTLRGSDDPDTRFEVRPLADAGAALAPADGAVDPAAGAAAWITPESRTVTLRPREVATVPLTITVPSNAPPGGWHAAVVVSTEQVLDETGAPTSVGVRSEVAVPLVVTIPGEIERELRLGPVSAQTVIGSSDRWTTRAVVHNDGGVHESPRGTMTIRTLWGSTVATLPVRARLLLPGGAERTFVTWKDTPVVGVYRTTLEVHGMRSESGPVPRDTHAGWLIVLPPWWWWLVLAGGLALLLRTWMARRRRRRLQLEEHLPEG